MTLKEDCLTCEAKLDAVSKALSDPRPEILEYCEAELHNAIELLESAKSSVPAAAGQRTDLMSLRQKVRVLAMQAQNAANLCQGWIQLGLSDGYTDQGKPVLTLSEPQTSYEV